jgi:hypothetical protein
MNKITNSYTAQYSITASHKLLPMVFICLQERSSAFSPCTCEEVNTFSQKFGNVSVTATKSGKLPKETYEHFLDNVIEPYVKKYSYKFLVILDSLGRETKPSTL